MKNFIDIIDGKKPVLTECATPFGSEVTTPPVMMNVNFNAQGIDQIKELLNLMNDAQATRMSEPMQMPTPGMPIGAPDIKIPLEKPTDPVLDIKHLAGLDSEEKPEESLDNQYDANTTPKPEYQDTDYMTKDLAGGLNKEKKSFKHSYKQGDNPMAMENIKQALYNAYQDLKQK